MAKKILAMALTIAAMLVGMASLASANGKEWRWEERDTVCVESTMGSGWTSDNAATAELDDAIWFWNLVHKEGAGSCDSYEQVINIYRVNDADRGRAWTRKAGLSRVDGKGNPYYAITDADLYMNTHSKFDRTWRQNKLTWMHEMVHSMASPIGPEWDSHGHTDRCDSLMSESYVCMSNYTDVGPSEWDQDWLADLYWEWRVFQFEAR